MGAPQGFTPLALAGYSDKGTYLASATYNRYNVVLYNGSTYVAIKDGITGVTPSNDGVNWRLFANGFPENGISTDNFQETLKQYISDSGIVNQEGFALDAREKNPDIEGSLAAQLAELNSGLERSLRLLSAINGTAGGDFNNYTQTGFHSFHGGPLHGPGDSVANKAYGLLNVYRTDVGYILQDCFWITSTYNRSWRISTDFGESWRDWNDY